MIDHIFYFGDFLSQISPVMVQQAVAAVEGATVIKGVLSQEEVDLHKVLHKLHLQVGVAAMAAVTVEETMGMMTQENIINQKIIRASAMLNVRKRKMTKRKVEIWPQAMEP